MEQQRLTLRYEGPAVDAGRMGVYDVATNLIAFSDFVVAAAKSSLGEKVEVKAEVAGFGKGSFITDVLFNVVGPTASILAAFEAGDLFKLVKESIALWKHLEGAPPKEVAVKRDEVHVTNRDGKVLVVQNSTVNLVLYSEKPAEAVERFVRRPLMQDGIEAIRISGESSQEETVINQSEAQCFVPVSPSEDVLDTQMRIGLVIESAAFKEGNKWRFSDGTSTFYAEIVDEKFLHRIDIGEERFGKGDVLIVRLRMRQVRTGRDFEVLRQVLEVIEHKVAPVQGRLEEAETGG